MLVDEASDFDDFSSTAMPMPMPMPAYYGQYVAPSYMSREQNVKVKEEKTKSQDQLLISTLKLLITFLPGVGSPSGPIEEIRLYRLSFLFDKITELLRNDSIIDITQRKDLYTEVFNFVQVSPVHLWSSPADADRPSQAVASSPDLVGLLLEERPDKSNSPGIHSIQYSSQRPGFVLEGIQSSPGEQVSFSLPSS